MSTRFLRLLRLSTAVLALGVFAVPVSYVSYAAENNNETISQGYRVSGDKAEDFVGGALVSVSSNDARMVELSTTKNTEKLVGIVDKAPLLAISSDTTEVQVVLSGTMNVLVSDVNGPIAPGDKIMPSPIAGVGMKAKADSRIVGTAQAVFDTHTATTRSITDTEGKQHDVHVGYVPLQVGTAYYQSPASSFLPPFLQRLATDIAGREVSAIRIVIAGAILLVGSTAIMVLLYSTVRSAVMALGRNPLASYTIRKGVFQVIMLVVSAFVAMLLAAYIIIVT